MKDAARAEEAPRIEISSQATDDLKNTVQKGSIRILHVDDDTSILEVSKLILTDIESSLDIDNACCVDEAFQKLATEKYDVIISDYEMPKKNGLQFLKELREQNNKIPFILFTGKGREEVAIQALNMGADGYIDKQGTPETVYGELKHIILSSFEKRNSQEMLWESEERFKKLVTNSKDAIMLTQADGIILYLSPACKNVLGYEPSELIGKVPWIIHPDDLERVQRVFQSALSSKVNETLEYRILTKQGETKWVKHAFSQIWENGVLRQIVSNLADITERKKTEAELRSVFEVLEKIGEGIDAGLAVIGKDYRIVWVNKHLVDLGIAPNDKCSEAFNNLGVVCPDCGVEQVFQQNVSLDVREYQTVNSKGETIWTELRVTPLKDKDGNVGAALVLTIPLNERKKKETQLVLQSELLATSEAKYRTLVEKSLQGILVTKVAPLKLVFANEAMGKFLGYSVEELLSLSPEGIMGLVHPEDRAGFFKRMENRFRGEPAESCLEFRAVRKDGSVIWLNAFANRVEYDGQPAVLGMFLDVDESKKAGEILRESEQRYRELANSLPDIVFETDINGQLEFANERAIEISGYSQEELEKGLNVLQFLVPEDREKAMKSIQRLLAGGRYVPAEYTFMRKDGTTFPALITATPCISKGKVTGLRGLVLDITERKKAEKVLQASEEQLRTIFEGASDGIIVADLKTKSFVFANPRICEITGYSLKELLGLNVSDIHPEKDLPSVTDQFTKQAQGKITLATNVPVLRKDRKVVYCDINSRPARIGEQEYLVGFFRDITERKETEEVLRQSEESFRSLIDSMDDLVFVLGFDGVFKNYHQPSHKKELYAAPEEFIGKHFRDVLPPHVAELCQAAMKRFEASGETQEFNYYMGMNGGKSWYNARLSPIKDQSGRKTSVTVVVRNITERNKAEEVIARLASFPALNPNPVVEVCFDGSINYVNSAAESAFPDLKKDGLNHPFFSGWNDAVATFKNEKTQPFNRNVKIGDAWFLQQFSLVTETQQVRIYVTNITEVKQAEEALRESETKFRMYVENSPVAVFVADSEGKYEYVNEAASKLLGYSAKELTGMSIPQIVFREEHPTLTNFNNLKEKGKILVEVRLKKKDGQAAYVSLNAVKLPSGKLMAFCENIAESKQAEEALKRSNAALVEAQNIAHLGSWEWNVETNQEFWSDELYRIYGYENQSFQPTPDTFLKALHPDDYLNVVNAAKRAFREKRRYDIECRIKRPNGETRYLHCQGEMQRDSQGKPVRMVGTDLDITERKKAEQAVSASLKRYQSFIEVTGELGWITNAAGEVEEDMPSFRNFTGQTYEEVKGWGWTKAVHPDDLEQATQAWQTAVAAKAKYEVEYRLHGCDGVYRNFMARGAPILEEDGRIREWVGTCIDITDRKEAEEKLANLKEFDERIIDSLDDALLVIDPDDYKIISINEAALQQLKLRKEELIGKTCYETTHHTLTPCKPPEHDCPIQRALETKETITVEHKHFDENNTERIVEVSARLVKNPKGKTVVIHVARDITERKKADEALSGLMNGLVLVNEKLNVVGSLTRHDVRNKLCAVTASAFMIKKKHADQPDIMDGLAKMEQAVKDVVKIFDFAKAYEELGVEELICINVEKALDEAVGLFPGSLSIQVINDCHGLTLLADSFLRQLFYNLIDNSLKHGEKVTRIRVHYEKADQDKLNVIYEDDGVGIPSVNKPSLFREGFSTGGSGYGLYLIKKMIEIYGWTIQENGEPNKGAKFTITIPKVNKNGEENYRFAQ